MHLLLHSLPHLRQRITIGQTRTQRTHLPGVCGECTTLFGIRRNKHIAPGSWQWKPVLDKQADLPLDTPRRGKLHIALSQVLVGPSTYDFLTARYMEKRAKLSHGNAFLSAHNSHKSAKQGHALAVDQDSRPFGKHKSKLPYLLQLVRILLLAFHRLIYALVRCDQDLEPGPCNALLSSLGPKSSHGPGMDASNARPLFKMTILR